MLSTGATRLRVSEEGEATEQRFVVRAHEKLTAFVELESAIRGCRIVSTSSRNFLHSRRRLEPGSGQEAFLPELSSPFSDVHCEGFTHRGQTKQRKINMKLPNLIHILIGIVCIGLLPRAQAVVPPPDGGYPGLTTADGSPGLHSLTSDDGNSG